MGNQYLYGFNFQWMYSNDLVIQPADDKALDFMQSLGLNFVRLPANYRFWTSGTDYFNPETAVLEHLWDYYRACAKRNIHFCLNLHRAPGYCINDNDLETHNLWLDPVAQDAFVFLWESLARRFKNIPATAGYDRKKKENTNIVPL